MHWRSIRLRPRPATVTTTAIATWRTATIASDVATKTATGEGPYAVMAGPTVVERGTFVLTRLVAFQFYGCGEVEGTTLPPNFSSPALPPFG